MVYLLLLLSFLIHIITFMYLKTMKEQSMNPDELAEKQAQHQKEMEELLAVYLLEIREENDKLLQAIDSSSNQNQQTFSNSQTDFVQSDEPTKIKTADQNFKKNASTKQTASYSPPDSDTVADTFEPSLSGQVLSMYHRGESIEAIARKLDCGKTEVELMVKFQQKNR